MRYILVATDFSEVAEHATHYACRLALDFNASVTVMHSFMIPVTFSDAPMPVMPLDDTRAMAEERMATFIAELAAQYPDLMLSSRIGVGEVVDSIEEYVQERDPWLIVLGNSGEGNSALWLGSNVVSALRKLRHPVMAVPRGLEYRRPEKVCFACDFTHVAGHLETGALDALIMETKAELHVLNVDHQHKHEGGSTLETSELHKMLSPLHPVYHYVEKEDVDGGIKEFVETNHMDWLVVVPHKLSFWEGLFHKSHTKALVKMTHIPIIALHER